MKRILLFLPILLACMTTTEPFVTYPVPTGDGTSAPTAGVPTRAAPLSQEPESGEVFNIQTAPAKEDQSSSFAGVNPRCATVTASEALHIRNLPNEKAEVIGYLHNGEQVIVMRSIGKWWRIDTGITKGYSKAEFLKESECE